MIEFVYQTLARIGYLHPLHPPSIHLPMGLVIGGFVFGLAGWLLGRQALTQTARHCTVLALITLLPALLLGFMDWQYRYAGAWLFPIKMKLILSGVLLILLSVAVILGRRSSTRPRSTIAIYALCLVTVSGIGYFGGELVYGKKVPPREIEGDLARKGAAIFDAICSDCHYADETEELIGPGLKGLFKRAKFPVSDRPVTAANVRSLLKTPFKLMPPFDDLSEEEVDALVVFLKTL